MKKLIAPKITDGAWRIERVSGEIWGIESENGDQIIETDCAYYPPREADAVFIAGSKRVSEAAAALLAQCDFWGPTQCADEIQELRAALLAQGYKETDK